MCRHFGLVCRLFQELWIPLVNDSFSTGAKVYNHLYAPTGKHLLHAAKSQPGMPRLPGNNAQKRQLLDTLVTLIDSDQHASIYAMPGPATKPESSASVQPTVAATERPGTPEVVDTPPATDMLPRKLVFDGSGMEVAQLMKVDLDVLNRCPPFIRQFPVPAKYSPLPGQFRPVTEKAPKWEEDRFRKQWAERRDAAFEVCKQAS